MSNTVKENIDMIINKNESTVSGTLKQGLLEKTESGIYLYKRRKYGLRISEGK